MFQLAGFHECRDGVFAVLALHDPGITVGGDAAAALAHPAGMNRPFYPYRFAFIAHHSGARCGGFRCRLTGCHGQSGNAKEKAGDELGYFHNFGWQA